MAIGAAAATVAAVRSESLNAKQIDNLARGVRSWCWYIDRLAGRMHQTMFPCDDPLRMAAEKAQAAAAELEAAVKELREREGKTRPVPPPESIW